LGRKGKKRLLIPKNLVAHDIFESVFKRKGGKKARRREGNWGTVRNERESQAVVEVRSAERKEGASGDGLPLKL